MKWEDYDVGRVSEDLEGDDRGVFQGDYYPDK
jgi:hypothetical protein